MLKRCLMLITCWHVFSAPFLSVLVCESITVFHCLLFTLGCCCSPKNLLIFSALAQNDSFYLLMICCFSWFWKESRDVFSSMPTYRLQLAQRHKIIVQTTVYHGEENTQIFIYLFIIVSMHIPFYIVI